MDTPPCAGVQLTSKVCTGEAHCVWTPCFAEPHLLTCGTLLDYSVTWLQGASSGGCRASARPVPRSSVEGLMGQARGRMDHTHATHASTRAHCKPGPRCALGACCTFNGFCVNGFIIMDT
jgi:hypothetical protein